MEIYYLFALFLKPVARAKRIAYLLSSSFFNFSEGLPPCFGLNSCERKWMCSVRSKPMKKPGVRSSVNWPTAFRVWSQESCQQQPSGLRVLRVKRVGQRHLLQQKDTKVMSASCAQKCLGVHAPKILRWSFCWVHHLKKDSKGGKSLQMPKHQLCGFHLCHVQFPILWVGNNHQPDLFV